ncbi:MAG: hypothetical protein GX493_04970, partial [Firmicutes bacterium]|nr:hypothetical protein [Bacillota bacterium]
LSNGRGRGGYRRKEMEPSGRDHPSFSPAAHSGGDDGFLAARPRKVVADPGDGSSGLDHGPSPTDPLLPAGFRPRFFFMLYFLLGVLFFLGLRQAGRGYAELTGEDLPPPLTFSRLAAHRYVVSFYDRRFTVNLVPLARRARFLVAEAGRRAAFLLDRLRFPGKKE